MRPPSLHQRNHRTRAAIRAANDPTFAPAGPSTWWTATGPWHRYTDIEHDVWNWLFHRQSKLMRQHGCSTFNSGLEFLNLSTPGVPDPRRLNKRLLPLSGWQIVGVTGCLPEEILYRHLAARLFPVAVSMRSTGDAERITEPDVFHGIFGHVPLLANRGFANVMQALGELGVRAFTCGKMDSMARLYWHIVELGLISENDELKIFGARLATSFGEARFALNDFEPVREPFSVRAALETPFCADVYQPHYFVIGDLAELLSEMRAIRW